MSIKVIKRIGFIICLLFMVFIIDCDNVSAIKEWPVYKQEAKNKLVNKTYCSYTIHVTNVDNSMYNGKEIILVPDTNSQTVYWVDPRTGDLMPTGATWAEDQDIQLGMASTVNGTVKPVNMYNYLVDSSGKVHCDGLAWQEDDAYGGLMVYDPQTIIEAARADVVVDVLGGDIVTPAKVEEHLSDNSGEGTGKDVATQDDYEGVTVTESCDGIIGPNVQKDIKKYLGYIRIIAPIIVIVLSAVDFSKVVLSGDDKEFAKMISTLVKRLIIAVALFIFPALLNFLIEALSKFADSRINGCELGKWW